VSATAGHGAIRGSRTASAVVVAGERMQRL